jgi:hypothetical protein
MATNSATNPATNRRQNVCSHSLLAGLASFYCDGGEAARVSGEEVARRGKVDIDVAVMNCIGVKAMDANWRRETTVSLCCLLLVPVFLATGLNSVAFWTIILCAILGFGIVCAVSGARRGSKASRCVSFLCLALLMIIAIGYVIFIGTDPWLNS